MNPGNHPACVAGGLSFWSTRQGGGDIGENIAETQGRVAALDGTNVRHNEVTSAMRMRLAVVSGPRTTAKEMGTLAYILHSLFRATCPSVAGILPLVDWINVNRSKWGAAMAHA